MGSCEWSGFTSGWLCAILWSSVLLCSEVGSTFYCPRFWRVLDCGPLTNGEVGLGPSSSSPVAFCPHLGLGLLRRPGGCCLSPARCLAGFSSLGWLAGCSPRSLPSCFRAAGLPAGCLRFYASLLPGGGSWFLLLAWRYGRCYWRRPFPSTWLYP